MRKLQVSQLVLKLIVVTHAIEFAKIVCQNVSNVQFVFKDVANFE